MIFSDRTYCIEVIPQGNEGNSILILRNDQVVDITPGLPNFKTSHKICFENFDQQNDILELRHSGGNDGVTISVNLIYQGVTSQLLFGLKADLTWIKIDGDGLKCKKDVEAAYTLRILNGKIIESECIGLSIISIVLFKEHFRSYCTISESIFEKDLVIEQSLISVLNSVFRE